MGIVRQNLPLFGTRTDTLTLPAILYDLDEEKNGYVARDQLLYAL